MAVIVTIPGIIVGAVGIILLEVLALTIYIVKKWREENERK